MGTLGIYYEGAPSGNTAVSAYHMRSILQNKTYFGPESAFVKFGGFTYDQYTTTTILTTSTISLDQLRRALEPADIVILPYLCNLPQSAVDVVYEWAQKPYHVLFVFADIESTTNTLMRKKLDSNLAWYTTGTLSLTTSNTNNSNMVNALGNDYLASLVGLNGSAYTMNIAMKDMIMASQTTDNMAIMGGPFGMPDQGATSTLAQYPMWDGYSQFAVPGVGSNVTPLAVFEGNVWGTNKTNTNYTTAAQLVRTKASLVSVDMPRTIVYIGESVLFLDYLNSTAPYDGSGVAGTPYKNSMTVLMSNIWAWAVKNVLAQIKEED